jgi:hypothetical protein
MALDNNHQRAQRTIQLQAEIPELADATDFVAILEAQRKGREEGFPQGGRYK